MKPKKFFLILLLPLVGTSCSYSQFNLPQPSGRYLVGTRHLSFTDSRREPFVLEQNEFRNMYAQVWYPAGQGTEHKAVYWDKSSQSSKLIADIFRLQGDYFDSLENIETSSFIEAPLAGKEKFPLLIFAHGYSFWAGQNTLLMEHLASSGYVVLSISFAYETAYQRMPGNALIVYDHQFPPLQKRWGEALNAGVAEIHRQRLHEENLDEAWKLEGQFLKMQPALQASSAIWKDDVTSWIDHVEKIQSQDSNPFYNRIDLGRIGIVGHSFGGSTAVLATLNDARIKAAINMDGAQFGMIKNDKIDKPLMFITSESREVDMNRIYYDQSTSDYYYVSVKDCEHVNFCDLPFFAPFLTGTNLVGSIDQERVSSIVNYLVLAFFEHHLSASKNTRLLVFETDPDYRIKALKGG